jgi:hypothetical protein
VAEAVFSEFIEQYTPSIPKYFMFNILDINFDHLSYSKYEEKIQHVLKIPHVINHIISKIKIILFFNKTNSQSLCQKVKCEIFVDRVSIAEVLWIEKYFLLMGT